MSGTLYPDEEQRRRIMDFIMAARARLASSRRAARAAGAAAASFASYWFTSAWAALSTASS